MSINTTARNGLARITRSVLIKGGWRVAPHLNRLFPHGPAIARVPRVGRVELDLRDEDQRQIYWAGLDQDDRRMIRLLGRILSPNGVFLDAGANIGLFALAAARIARRGTVMAFEPNPANVSVLRANVARNGLANVTIADCGLYDEASVGRFRITGRSGNWSLASDEGTEEVEVKLIPLDSYMLSRIDVLKLDVEGAEVRVLRGAAETIRRCRPIILSEVGPAWLTRMGSSVEELFNTFHDLGYTLHQLARSPDAVGPPVAAAEIPRQSQFFTNLLALPRENFR